MTAIAPTEPSPLGLRPVLRDAAPLLLGLAAFMAGNGLASTLLGARAVIEGFRPATVGVVLTGFYLGLTVGSLKAPSTIARVGHIRVFAGLASLSSASILLHLMRPQPATWFLLRAVSGLCLSGLYVVSETWLNGVATNRSRGTLFAVYMAVTSAALLVGQVLFASIDPAGTMAFLVASVLFSVAVVPVSLASYTTPAAPDPQPMRLRDVVAAAPLAPVGAALAGFIGSAMLGAGVVYASVAGMNTTVTGALIGSAVLGGALLPIPVGPVSDRVDRRLVIIVVSTVAAVACVAVALIGPTHRLVIIALTLVAGGSSYPLYSLANAHLNDYLEESLRVAAGARMVLVNGIGAIGGPIVGAVLVGQVGPGALFVAMALAYGFIALFAFVRVFVRGAPPQPERAEFVPIPAGLVPPISVYDGDVDDLYPPVEASFDVDGESVTYRLQGPDDADVAVLLGSVPGREESWTWVLPAIAMDGFRGVTLWNTDRPKEPVRSEAILALLRELEVPWACYVAAGRSRALARHMAAEHPDRTDAIALIRLAADERDVTTEHEALAPYPVLLIDAADWEDAEHLADDIAEALRRR